MYEEVCEAAQPTYGGGRGGHGGASGGYGAAKAPACRQVLVDFTYWRHFINQLLLAFTISLRSRQVPRQECKNVPKQVCTNVPQQVCNSVPRQKCRNVPTKKCDNVPRQVIKMIGRMSMLEKVVVSAIPGTLKTCFVLRLLERIARQCLCRSATV